MDFNTIHQKDLCIWYKQENLSIAITTREKINYKNLRTAKRTTAFNG